MPKETGLMFKAPLVRVILDDLKTQTRRIAKLPHMNPLGEWEPTTVGGPGGGRTRDGKEIPLQVALGHTRTGDVICAPYQAGDRIYVRETFAPFERNCFYRADGDNPDFRPWKPAIHMPRSLARIWLEVTGVRVERLQAITRGDAMAEGCPFPNMADGADPRKWFEEVWDSTGGDWALNPWVWVMEFKRIEKP